MKTNRKNTTTITTTKKVFDFYKILVINILYHFRKNLKLLHDFVRPLVPRFLFVVSLILLLASCNADKDPVLDLQDITPPEFRTPLTGGSIILTESNAADTFPTFNWTATQYNFDRPLAKTTYSLQMDIESGDFVEFTTLTNTNALTYSMTNESLNTRLLMQDMVVGEAHKVYFRVGSFIVALGDRETQYSNVVSVDVTPYAAEISYPPIYLLGDATTIGWDADNALETPYQKDGVFSVIQTLKSNGYYKFIANRGSWAPQWGTNASGTWEGGTLVYRASESEPDPSAIPSPPIEGLYEITVDTTKMIYNVIASSPY